MVSIATVLVIDDDLGVHQIVRSALEIVPEVRVAAAIDGDEGLQSFDTDRPTVVLLDIRLPSHNGLELFRKLKSIDRSVPVIFITGDTSSETTIMAMRLGAYDYLAKPLAGGQLRALVQSAIRSRTLMDSPVAISVGGDEVSSDRIVSCSPAMVQVYKDIGRVASQNVTVLIRGESGVGKELVARALQQYSDRVHKPFMAVNCAAIPDQLLESELFGHERGAFTGADRLRIGRFEQCHGGTIFLDEVGDMSPLIQGKVLRLLQEQCFERLGGNETVYTDVRILAATNRPLEQMVAKREFRDDLLFRLNGYTIHVPSLGERPEDIPLLLRHYLTRAKVEMGLPDLRGISRDALERLVQYTWPGNIRQLQSVVRQALLNSSGTVVDVEHLPSFLREYHPPTNGQAVRATYSFLTADEAGSVSPNGARTFDRTPETMSPTLSREPLSSFIERRLLEKTNNLYLETLEQMERMLFAKVLASTHGNKTRAAELLGISRTTVRERATNYRITNSDD